MAPKIGSTSLHARLQARLIGEFADLPLGAKIASDRELARRFRVAPLTINKVMTQLERDDYVTRKRGSGTYLATREKIVRRVGGANGTLVFAYPDYYSHEYWKRAHLAHTAALKLGITLVELKIYENAEPLRFISTIAQQENLRGVLLDPVPGTLSAPLLSALDQLGAPTVIFSHCAGIEKTKRLFSVVPAWRTSGYEQARLLLAAGRRKLAYIRNEPSGKDGGLAYLGIKRALTEFGLRLKDLTRPQAAVASWQSSRVAGYELTRAAWKMHRPDGFIYTSFNGVLGGMKFLRENGISVPADAGVVTFGNTNDLEAYLTPPVSSVVAPLEREIELAMKLIIDGGRRRRYECAVAIEQRGSE